MRVDQWVSENFSIWNISEQKFHNDSSSLALKSESLCSVRRFTRSLVEPIESICVLSSDSFDSSCVVKVFAKFII